MLPMNVLDIIGVEAVEHGLPKANLAAVIDVESRGQVFANVGGQLLPLILFEPHIFYRRLTGAARDEAVQAKLASKSWNKRLYPKTQGARWEQIELAADLLTRHGLDPNIAGECASYGVGQVMGYHWKSLGFSNFQAFWDRMMSGAEGQIEIMIRYIKVNSLDDEIIDGRWPAFFRGYNGPDYKRGGYDKKIGAALAMYGGTSTEADGMLRMGAKGAKVRELQALLVRAGYQVKVDGDFGPSTRNALKEFQTSKDISVDGVYGPETEGALSSLRQGAADKPGEQKVTEVDGVIKGVGTAAGGIVIAEKIDAAKEAIEGAIPQLQQLDALSQWVNYGVTALTVVAAVLAAAGAGWALYSWLQSRNTVEV